MNLVTALDMQEYAPTEGGDAAEKEMVVDSTGAPLDTTETTDAAEAEAVVTDGEMQQVEEETEQLETTADTVGAIEDEVSDSIVDGGDAIEAEIPETAVEEVPEEQKVVAQENYFMQTTLAHAMRCVGVTTMATCESRTSLRSNLALTQESLREAVTAGMQKLWQKIQELIASITDRGKQYRQKIAALATKLKPQADVEIDDGNRAMVALDDNSIMEPEHAFDAAAEYAQILNNVMKANLDDSNPEKFLADFADKEFQRKTAVAANEEMLKQHSKQLSMGQKMKFRLNTVVIKTKLIYLLDVAEKAKAWLDKAGQWVKTRGKSTQMESLEAGAGGADEGAAGGDSQTSRMSKAISLVRAGLSKLFAYVRFGYGWLKIAAFLGAKMVMSTVGRK